MVTFNAYQRFVGTMQLLQVAIGVIGPLALVFYAGYVCGSRRRVTKVWNVQNGSFPVMPGATVTIGKKAGTEL